MVAPANDAASPEGVQDLADLQAAVEMTTPTGPPGWDAHGLSEGFNEVRFQHALRTSEDFLSGLVACETQRLISLLHDVRYQELPAAFAVALFRACRDGAPRVTLRAEFAKMVEIVVFSASGSLERQATPNWLRYNWSFFVYKLFEVLLYVLGNDDLTMQPAREARARRAFVSALELVDGLRPYMSLDACARSSAVHTLLCTADSFDETFLRHGYEWAGGEAKTKSISSRRPITYAHVVFMDEVARAILKAEPLSRDIGSWTTAFGFVAGSGDWRSFLWRCGLYVESKNEELVSRGDGASTIALGTSAEELEGAINTAILLVRARARRERMERAKELRAARLAEAAEATAAVECALPGGSPPKTPKRRRSIAHLSEPPPAPRKQHKTVRAEHAAEHTPEFYATIADLETRIRRLKRGRFELDAQRNDYAASAARAMASQPIEAPPARSKPKPTPDSCDDSDDDESGAKVGDADWVQSMIDKAFGKSGATAAASARAPRFGNGASSPRLAPSSVRARIEACAVDVERIPERPVGDAFDAASHHTAQPRFFSQPSADWWPDENDENDDIDEQAQLAPAPTPPPTRAKRDALLGQYAPYLDRRKAWKRWKGKPRPRLLNISNTLEPTLEPRAFACAW